MKTPMELLKAFAPEFAKNQMDERALLFEKQATVNDPVSNAFRLLSSED